MPPSIKDVKTSISKANIYLDEVESFLEERDRMVHVLKLTPSSNDNYDLVSLIQRLLKSVNYLQDDLIHLMSISENIDESVLSSFQSILTRYDEYIEQLSEDAYVTVDEYKLVRKPLPTRNEAEDPSKKVTKAVRFRDDVSNDNEELRSELMGTRAFKPYSDEDDGGEATDANSFDNQTNQQIFAKHQQELLSQDQDLDLLHESIKRQHAMGININTEIDDHIIMLDDLEQGVDNSRLRLNSAANRLSVFRKRVAENGSLVTIVVLTIVVIVLLVTLN